MQNGHPSDDETPRNTEGFNASISDHVSQPTNNNDESSDLVPADNTAIPSSETAIVEITGRRGRKRRLAESTLARKARQLSPPWKRVQAEGPTSFIKDGRRKSGRTNSVPVELQPTPAKRQRRSAPSQPIPAKEKNASVVPRNKSRLSTAVSISSGGSFVDDDIDHAVSVKAAVPRGKKRTVPVRLQEEKKSVDTPHNDASPLAALSRRHTTKAPARHRRAAIPKAKDGSQEQITSTIQSAVLTPPDSINQTRRLRLNYRPPPMPLLHPLNIPAPRLHETLQHWFDADNSFEGEDGHRLSVQEATEEAVVLNKVEAAVKPGGILREGLWQQGEVDEQEVPVLGFAHLDYLLKHIEDFQPRLERERKEHLLLAKRLAHMALAEYKRRQPLSDEELLKAQTKLQRAKYRDGIKELERVWNRAKGVIRVMKKATYENEQIAAQKKKTTELLIGAEKFGLAYNAPKPTSEALLRTTLQDTEESPAGDEQGDENNGSDFKSTGGVSSGTEGDSDDEMTSGGETDEDDAPNIDDSLEPGALREKYQGPLAKTSSLLRDLNSTEGVEMEGNSSVMPADSVENKDPTISIETLIDQHGSQGIPSGVASLAGDINPAEVVLDDLPEIFDENEGSDDDNSDDSDDSNNSNDSEDTDESGQSNSIQAESESDEQEDNGGAGFSMAAFFTTRQLKDMSRPIVDTPPTSFDEREEDEDGTRLVTIACATSSNIGPLRQTDPGTSSKADIPEVRETRSLLDQTAAESDCEAMQTDEPEVETSYHRQNLHPMAESSRQTTPTALMNGNRAGSVSSLAPFEAMRTVDSLHSIDRDAPSVEIPPLLRGELREYQHKGLDWLASMYAQNSNGILADEMGLGKTIQTISLLAHLATSYGIWGPHLVVVPNSVVYNWDVEFKKFLPGFKVLVYYGSPEERKVKRRGWMDNNLWNVCIVSYTTAVQDALILKRKRWHYMILDEAHNIKNFNSQRWQTLLRFNAHARLLITGTPLQNNLSELWSLLFFLMPEEDENGESKFRDLKSFQDMFRRPVDQILENGREAMDEEGKLNVEQLHKVLRPHLLRRLKADVEKQMPKKYEHIVPCRLSKRQRELYDGYMGLARTRDSFESGNYLSIINCLMQLRKVCNHPDLFETRQIVTSYAMPKSAIADYEITDLLVRRRLLVSHDEDRFDLKILDLTRSNVSTRDANSAQRLAASRQLQHAVEAQRQRIAMASSDTAQTAEGALATLDLCTMKNRLDEMRSQLATTNARTHRRPAYSSSLLEKLTIDMCSFPIKSLPKSRSAWTEHYLNTSSVLRDMIVTLPQRARSFETYVEKFACVTPAVTAPDLVSKALTQTGISLIQAAQNVRPYATSDYDPFHSARVRLSIAFPDRSLVQYDCGKLQALARLLRQLQKGGHRALIFTQMTKVLDILEQFLNLHGYLYLRLDGATKLQDRQVMTENFNRDPRIKVFILSSRSGGQGINLTGADTVIFYDLDWNPAMDKQCQDRCHRIGQTRDVHIYRFVCEGTIEANILRKSNQKRMLDDVVIQEGDFTTEYLNRMEFDQAADGPNTDDANDPEKYANAALDKVLGSSNAASGAIDKRAIDRALAEAEDKEDVEAAKEAAKEADDVDQDDFNEGAAVGSTLGTSTAGQGTPVQEPSTPTAFDAHQDSTPAAAEDVIMHDMENAVEDTLVATTTGAQEEVEVDRALDESDAEQEERPIPSTDDYMIRFMEWEMQNWVYKEPSERSKRGQDGKSSRARSSAVPRIRR